MLDYAREYIKKGYSVIPLIPKDKKPILKWEEFQKRQPTEEELEKWFAKTKNNIGIVTGEISKLSIIDMDGKPAVDFMTTGHDLPVTPMVRTGKDYGYHLYCGFNQGLRNFQARDDLPSIDLRSEGGYVVAPPSIHPNGKIYEWVTDYNKPVAEVPAWFLSLISGPKAATTIPNKDSFIPNSFNINLYNCIFGANRKDIDLFHVGNAMAKGRLEQEYLQKVLELLINSWGENDPKWAAEKVKSIMKRLERRDGKLSEEVRDYVLSTTGIFLSRDVRSSLQLSTRDEEKNLSIILSRLKDDGIIEKYGNKNGCFRLVNKKVEVMNIMDADITPINIEWPFNMGSFIKVLKRTIVVVAGVTNAGKSGYLLNVAKLNRKNHDIKFFSSEMGPEEMKERLLNFEIGIEEWERVQFCKKADDAEWCDVIEPSGINIIDYIEIYKDFSEIAGTISRIFEKIDKGVVIISLQKKEEQKYGRGAEFSMEKARIYMTIDQMDEPYKSKIKILKAKQRINPKINPNMLECHFTFDDWGCKINPVTNWHNPFLEKKNSTYIRPVSKKELVDEIPF